MAGESPARLPDGGDDLQSSYGEPGLISYVADGVLRRSSPDGTAALTIFAPIAKEDWASQSPDRNRFLLSIGGKLFVLERTSDSFVKRPLSLSGSILGGTDCHYSPDGLNVSFVTAPGGAIAVGEIKEEYKCVNTACPTYNQVKRPAENCDVCGKRLDKTVSSAPFAVTTPAGGATSPHLTPGNRDIVFGDPAGNVFRVSAAEESPVTTINVRPDGQPEFDGKRPTISPDGKRVASLDGAKQVVVRPTQQAARKVAATGSYTEVVFSPNGRNLALTDGKKVYVTSASGSIGTTQPVITVVEGYGSISSLSWR
jgi:hypothetical protein